jgi:CheY-like chemotaxis protein
MVTLPRQAPPEPSRGKDRPTVPERVSVEPHRVLVVDDNQAVAESLSELLQLMGYEVQMELTGPDGVRAAGEFRPHAVLCDLGLPGLNGYQVAASLRSEPGTADTLLIALTGEGSEGAASHALAAGFDHFLLKPFEPAELQRLLDASLLGPSADPS